MRRPNGSSATNILLLVIYCFWCHIQSTAGGKCSGQWAIHACAGGNGKRSGTDDLVTDLGDISDIQEARGGERSGGGREGDGYRDSSEGGDLRQLLEGRQLLDIVNRRTPVRSDPLDSALNRLRSLLRTTELDVEDRKKEKEQEEEEEKKQEQWQEEEPQRRSNTDTDRRYIVKDTMTMLRRILDDIESRLDSQPDLDSKTQGHAVVTQDNYRSRQKRASEE